VVALGFFFLDGEGDYKHLLLGFRRHSIVVSPKGIGTHIDMWGVRTDHVEWVKIVKAPKEYDLDYIRDPVADYPVPLTQKQVNDLVRRLAKKHTAPKSMVWKFLYKNNYEEARAVEQLNLRREIKDRHKDM